MLDTIPPIPLFDGLEPEQVAMLKALFEPVHYPPGATIITQGEIAVHLYLTIKGEAVIHYKPYDGPSLVITRLHAGDVFGWSAVIGSRFYTSTIVSETEVDVIRIKGSAVLSLLENHPETGRIILDRIVCSVSPRWQDAHEQVEALLNSR
jgi:glutaminase